MTSRTSLVPAALAAAAALVLAACGGGAGNGGPAGTDSTAEGTSARGGNLSLGIVQEPMSWDPAQAHVGHRLQPFQAAYDSLLLREPDGTLAPMLATEWGYTDEESTVLSLELRDDVTFSDGEAFDAAAVVANLEHFRTANGPQAAQAASIESVEAVADHTVEITLSQPDPALEYYLSQALGLMGSPAAIGTDEIIRTPVGSGPYTMVEGQAVVGSQYVFEAREDYWNPDLQHWDRVTLRLLADVTSRVNALVSGEVQATLLDGPTYQQAEGSGFEMLEYGTDWGGLLLLDRDGQVNEAMADVRVRQAINYAFDREALLQEVFGGFGETTSQVFGPDSSAFVADLDDHYTYDPDRARELLAEAGYGDGLTIEMPVATPGAETIMTFVAQQLGDVGITVQQTSVPVGDYQGELGQGNYAAAWFNLFQGPTWVAYGQLLAPSTLYNPFGSTAPELEQATEALRAGSEEEEAAAAQELNRFLVENAWFAPWYRPSQLYFYDADSITVEAQTQMAVPSIYNYRPAS